MAAVEIAGRGQNGQTSSFTSGFTALSFAGFSGAGKRMHSRYESGNYSGRSVGGIGGSPSQSGASWRAVLLPPAAAGDAWAGAAVHLLLLDAGAGAQVALAAARALQEAAGWGRSAAGASGAA